MLGRSSMLSSLGMSAGSALRRRCLSTSVRTPLEWAHNTRRCYSSKPSRFGNTKKRQVEVLEKEPEPAQQQSSLFGFGRQAEVGSQQQQAAAPSSAFPSYVRDREEQTGSQFDALSAGAVEHMRKVYGTLAIGVGIAAGASLFTMATPLVGMHPLIPGLAAIVPLMGIMYTSKHTHSAALRSGLFAAFTGLSGVAMAPMLKFALAVSPALVPQALLITTGLFGTMTALSLMAKPGATLRWGVPLGGGLIVLMVTGIGSMFVPVTSAWYPLLHNVMLYGGLALFTAYVAYDTQKMIDEYEMGIDDVRRPCGGHAAATRRPRGGHAAARPNRHRRGPFLSPAAPPRAQELKHATDLFIDFKVIFQKVLQILMMSRD